MQRDHARLGACVVLLLLLGALAVYFGREPAKRWMRDRTLTEAKEFAAKKDYRSALVALHRAVDKNPHDREVWRQVADFLTEMGSPDVLTAKRNLLSLSPDDMSLRLGFVLDALKFGDVEAAREAANGVREGAREDVEFFRMTAALAVSTGKQGELEASLEELVRRAPGDHETALDLACLRLWGPDAARAAEARAALLRLLEVRDVRVRSAVELLKHAARTGERAEADFLVARIHEHLTGRAPTREPGSDQPPGWFTMIERLKAEAETSAPSAAVLARWLGALGLGREAIVWLERVPERVREAAVVKAVALDLAVAVEDMERLRSGLREGAWGRLPTEAVDLAFAARWQRRASQPDHARETWGGCAAGDGRRAPGFARAGAPGGCVARYGRCARRDAGGDATFPDGALGLGSVATGVCAPQRHAAALRALRPMGEHAAAHASDRARLDLSSPDRQRSHTRGAHARARAAR
jgi:tetratricopeptide (TPR) repeat protein